MPKLFVISDVPIPSGYGRIAAEVCNRLHKRGYEIMVASLTYDGLLPASFEGEALPYHVAALNGKDWVQTSAQLINVWQPDMIWVAQDFPYSQGIRNAPLDWSKYGFIILSPVDGAPIYPRWIDEAKRADATLTISEYGVKAFKAQGIEAGLIRPAANLNAFYPISAERKAEVRQALGIAPDAFVLGTCAMNQGRKAISTMIECFYKFAEDKPTARYLLNMERTSPAGWDIPGMICEPNGWDMSKLIFRDDCEKAGIGELRERYNIMDAHAVIAHREGFGLPLTESQCCGVATMAMDYCSGTEVCENGNGVLVKTNGYSEIGTWGGARDMFVDKQDFVEQLQWLYNNPAERAAIGKRGMDYARAFTWDKATDVAHATFERVMDKRRAILNTPIHTPMPAPAIHPPSDISTP